MLSGASYDTRSSPSAAPGREPLSGGLRSGLAALLLLGIVLGSVGQICLKVGLAGSHVASAASPALLFMTVLSWVAHPWVLAGLGLYAASTVIWLLVISRVRLSVAYPMISISYVLVTVLSAVLLHERVTWSLAVPGLACIGSGVALIGWRS